MSPEDALHRPPTAALAPHGDLLTLDGSFGEGGGQILRTALFLSLLTRTPFRIQDVRKNRTRPGLKPQHLGIVALLERMTGSQSQGLRLGSTELVFHPGRLQSGTHTYDVGTAGSLPLFLQTLLPVALVTPGRTDLTLVGGTDVPGGPTIDWIKDVYLRRVRGLASRATLEIQRRGFAPAGGGRIRLIVDSPDDADDVQALRERLAQTIPDLTLSQGPPDCIGGISVATTALRNRRVVERQREAAQQAFRLQGLPAPAMQEDYEDSFSPGSSTTVWMEDTAGRRLGADMRGQPGRYAEDVGHFAAMKLLEDWNTDATVDRHMADHMAPWIALGAPKIRIPMATLHLDTNIWVCQRFLGADAVIREGYVVRAR